MNTVESIVEVKKLREVYDKRALIVDPRYTSKPYGYVEWYFFSSFYLCMYFRFALSDEEEKEEDSAVLNERERVWGGKGDGER